MKKLKKYNLLNSCPECGRMLELRHYKEIRLYCTSCKQFKGVWGEKWLIKVNKTKKRIDINDHELISLKRMEYKKYLSTGHWKRRKLEYYKNHKKICFCCGEKSYVLHHCSYENRGEEKDEDLVTLCEDCHNDIHDRLLLEKDINLLDAHIAKKQLLSLDN